MKLLSFLSILIFSYILLFYHLENSLINRVSELYNSLYPNSTSTIKSASDIELLTINLKKLNSDKNLEIELLKKLRNENLMIFSTGILKIIYPIPIKMISQKIEITNDR